MEKGLLKVQGYGVGRDITHSPMVQTPCMSTRPGSVAAWRRITHDSIPSSHWLQVDRSRHDRPPHLCKDGAEEKSLPDKLLEVLEKASDHCPAAREQEIGR